MSSDKLPALQFYPGDWRKDPGVRALKPIERYVWFEMLLVMHESEPRGYFVLNDKPYPVARFAAALNMKPSTVTQIVSSIVELGLCSVSQLGFCYSRRMVRDEDIRQKRKSAGSLGGNPNLVNQNASKTQPTPQAKRKQNPTPSFSSSTSLSNSTTVNKKKASLSLADFEIPEMLDNELGKKALQDWLDYKREKKQGYTQKGFQTLLKQKEDWTTSRLAAAVDYSMAANYSGIFEPSGSGQSSRKIMTKAEREDENFRNLYEQIKGEQKNGEITSVRVIESDTVAIPYVRSRTD